MYGERHNSALTVSLMTGTIKLQDIVFLANGGDSGVQQFVRKHGV